MRQKLIEFRGARSQQEMAETYDVTQQTWSKWERGEGFPRVPLMLRLEKDSGIPVGDLFFNERNNLLLLKEVVLKEA